MNLLLEYLNENGILLCNPNPDLPSLEEVGCTWRDVTELIDAHRLFYSKAFRQRTTYLSPEVYYLLKSIKAQKPLTESAAKLYSILEEAPGADTAFLKRVSLLPPKEFQKGFDFLLRHRYITALSNGTWLNETWSTFCYGTAAEWERLAPNVCARENNKERLEEILSHTMTQKQIQAFIR